MKSIRVCLSQAEIVFAALIMTLPAQLNPIWDAFWSVERTSKPAQGV